MPVGLKVNNSALATGGTIHTAGLQRALQRALNLNKNPNPSVILDLLLSLTDANITLSPASPNGGPVVLVSFFFLLYNQLFFKKKKKMKSRGTLLHTPLYIHLSIYTHKFYILLR